MSFGLQMIGNSHLLDGLEEASYSSSVEMRRGLEVGH
jgi:hypothetical protein